MKTSNAGEDAEKLVTHTLLAGMQNGTATLLNSLVVFKQSTQIPPDTAVASLAIYLREMKVYFPTKACAQMFVAASFVIAPKWKQSSCSSTGEWIDKMWYITYLQYYN